MASRWERFLRLLGKPVVYDNIRTFESSKQELVAFVYGNQNNCTGEYIGKHWHLGPGMITHYLNSETIGFYKTRKNSFTGDHAILWFDWPTPPSSWYPDTGLMELMLEGMKNDRKVIEFLIQGGQDRA